MSTRPIDPTDPRFGAPADKFAAHATPLLTEDRRQAVVMLLFPPEALRDQPLAVVEDVVFSQAEGILRMVAGEIHRAYTSEPVDPTTAANLGQLLTSHAQAARGER